MTKIDPMFVVMKHTRMFAAMFSDPLLVFPDRTDAREYAKEANRKAKRNSYRTKYTYTYTVKRVAVGLTNRQK